MRLRSVLFWLHLACGVVAGVVILIMSVTGVLLTYQRQITAWADTRGYRIEPAPQRMSADAIVAKVAEERPDLSPTAVIVRSEPAAPVSLTVGTGRQLFVDPYTGAVLGEGNGQDVRAFFRKVVEWHRYVAMSGDERPLGRAITGAANLMFLFIVVERDVSVVAAHVHMGGRSETSRGSAADCLPGRVISTGTTRLDSGRRFRSRSSLRAGSSFRIRGRLRWCIAHTASSRRPRLPERREARLRARQRR